MFYQILLSSQVKPCAITTYKHGGYEMLPSLQTAKDLGS